jgi:spore coat polysaccharide biosynthesis predicted glycosyltransferase SpsG
MWSTIVQGKNVRRKYKQVKEHLPDLIVDDSYCIEIDYKNLWGTVCLKPPLIELQ